MYKIISSQIPTQCAIDREYLRLRREHRSQQAVLTAQRGGKRGIRQPVLLLPLRRAWECDQHPLSCWNGGEGLRLRRVRPEQQKGRRQLPKRDDVHGERHGCDERFAVHERPLLPA